MTIGRLRANSFTQIWLSLSLLGNDSEISLSGERVWKLKENLASFELALRDAGIQQCNLVPVSSIIPPSCKLIPKEKGIRMLHAGEITFGVLAEGIAMSMDDPISLCGLIHTISLVS